MNEFHTRDEIPLSPGLYWVVKKKLVRTEGSTRTYQYCDRGFARWDGACWDGTEDWDLWHGEAQKEKHDTQTKA